MGGRQKFQAIDVIPENWCDSRKLVWFQAIEVIVMWLDPSSGDQGPPLWTSWWNLSTLERQMEFSFPRRHDMSQGVDNVNALDNFTVSLQCFFPYCPGRQCSIIMPRNSNSWMKNVTYFYACPINPRFFSCNIKPGVWCLTIVCPRSVEPSKMRTTLPF